MLSARTLLPGQAASHLSWMYREEEQVQKPHLVVVPLSTFPNWEREFALWAPQLNVVPFIGNQAGRHVIKQYELYADPSLLKGKSKTHSRHADLQVSTYYTSSVPRCASACLPVYDT